MRRFTFGGVSPRLDLTFRRTFEDTPRFDLRGEYSGQDFVYNGVQVQRVDGALLVSASASDTTVQLDPMLVVRDEGRARGGLLIDRAAGLAVFHGRSTLAPRALLQMIGLVKPGQSTIWSFNGPAEIEAEGQAGLEDRDKTAFTASVRGRDVTLRGFTTEKARFRLEVTGRTNRVSNLVGTLYGGDFEGDVTLVDGKDPAEPTQYVMSTHVRNASFGSIARTLSGGEASDYEGTFSADLRMGGRMGTGQGYTAAGHGSVKVVRGRVFRLRVFGGLSELMTRIIPGLDFVIRQNDARASFTIANGKVMTDKIDIEGDVLSLTGKGAYAFNGELGFEVQVTLMKEHTLVSKVLRTVTYPISKLLEFRLEGTLVEPTWRSMLLTGPAEGPSVDRRVEP
jgi:hypothetical protein